MPNVPETSITLLKAIAASTDSVRWTEFHNKYAPIMRAYLQSRYPYVAADDVIQETCLALMRALPDYHYTPDEKGHFHNYLIGIVAHKALDHARKEARTLQNAMKYAHDPTTQHGAGEDPAEATFAWKNALKETAVEQLMSDTRIQASTREIFRHAVLQHESPDAVAKLFAVTRNNVDQIKRRMIGKLARMISQMQELTP